MPTRTNERWVSGRVTEAAVLARWTTGGSIPTAARVASTALKRSTCTPVNGSSGTSAVEQCENTPSRIRPVSLMWRAVASASSGRTPTRCIPVSTFRWTADGPTPARVEWTAAA